MTSSGLVHAVELCVSVLEVQGMGDTDTPPNETRREKSGKKYDMRDDFETDNNKTDNSVPIKTSNVSSNYGS